MMDRVYSMLHKTTTGRLPTAIETGIQKTDPIPRKRVGTEAADPISKGAMFYHQMRNMFSDADPVELRLTSRPNSLVSPRYISPGVSREKSTIISKNIMAANVPTRFRVLHPRGSLGESLGMGSFRTRPSPAMRKTLPEMSADVCFLRFFSSGPSILEE
jgi:hypothetical protein